MANVTLTTSGLHCRSCSMLVDMSVGDLEGIVSSETDYTTGVTEIDFDPEVVGVEVIIEAIRAAGYDAERA